MWGFGNTTHKFQNDFYVSNVAGSKSSNTDDYILDSDILYYTLVAFKYRFKPLLSDNTS